MSKIPTGIQLYTVREECKADFKGTLKELAELGYSGVEFAWQYGDMSPEELSAFLKEVGLKACGLHAPLNDLFDPGSDSYTYAKAIGSKYVTTSMAGEVAKDWDAAIANAAKAGKVAKECGVSFTYHNHAQEFEMIGNEYALDKFYRETDPETVKCELDTYWIKKGGADPIPYIRKYGDRTPQIHLKDMNPDNGEFAEVGSGLMDVPGIFALAEEIGATWVIYEQDSSKTSGMDSAEKSIKNLAKLGLV